MSVLPANSVVVYASPEFNADYEHAVMDPPDPDNPWRNGPVFMKTGDAHRLFTESAAFTLPPRDGTGPRLVLPQRAPRTDYMGPANPKKKLPELLVLPTSVRGKGTKGGARRKVHGCALETVGLTAAGEALAAEKYQPVLMRGRRACLCGAWTFTIELTAWLIQHGRFQMTVTSCPAAPGDHGPECIDAPAASRVTATQRVALRRAIAHPCVTAAALARGTRMHTHPHPHYVSTPPQRRRTPWPFCSRTANEETSTLHTSPSCVLVQGSPLGVSRCTPAGMTSALAAAAAIGRE